MLPVSVLIPTRNSMALLPSHIESMLPWLDLAEEVIVVDSDSTDGTIEFLKRNLTGANVRFLRHPPGLYQSWNHGIGHVRSTYTYISTVGDGMSRGGLQHLTEVTEQLTCDVVISPPGFVSERGRKRTRDWPVQTIIKHARVRQPICLEGLSLFVIACAMIPHAVLGSSASNLYRTSALQRHPFPSDFGHHGDGAWAVGNSLRIRLGVTPQEVSFFREHRRSYAIARRAPELELQMIELALEQLRCESATRPELKSEAADCKLESLLVPVIEAKKWRSRLRAHRAMTWPWVLNPLAWWAKYRQAVTQHQCEELIRRTLTSLIGMESSVEPETRQR